MCPGGRSQKACDQVDLACCEAFDSPEALDLGQLLGRLLPRWQPLAQLVVRLVHVTHSAALAVARIPLVVCERVVSSKAALLQTDSESHFLALEAGIRGRGVYSQPANRSRD